MRGGYDGLVVLSCLTRASFPRPLLAHLSPPRLVADLVSSLSVLFLQDAGVRGLAAVHGEAAGGGDTSGGGGHLLYLGYRLTGARRPGLDTWQQQEEVEEEEDTGEEDEDEAEVKQQLEAGGMKERVAALVLVRVRCPHLASNNISSSGKPEADRQGPNNGKRKTRFGRQGGELGGDGSYSSINTNDCYKQ